MLTRSMRTRLTWLLDTHAKERLQAALARKRLLRPEPAATWVMRSMHGRPGSKTTGKTVVTEIDALKEGWL